MSSQKSQTQSQTTTNSESSLSQTSSDSSQTESCFTCSSEEVSSLSSAYDSQDENLSQELDSDWSEPDDEENDPTWVPQKCTPED